MPPMYNYSFTPLQRSYTRNISGRTRDFHITAWVRYNSEGPTTPGGLFILIDEDRGAHLLLLVTTLVSPGLRVSSSSDPKIHEDGPSPHLLLTSASLFLTSCFRAPSATGPKVVSPIDASRALWGLARGYKRKRFCPRFCLGLPYFRLG